MKTQFYQLISCLIRNLGGEIGIFLRRQFYKFAGVKIGKNVIIRENVFIYRPYNLEIGDDSEIGVGSVISAVNKITIGKHVGIGPYTAIYDNDHKMPRTDKENNLISNPVKIRDGAWIGTHVVILKGVTIGKNVTVGAGSVVNSTITDNMVALGNPARVIKTNQIK